MMTRRHPVIAFPAMRTLRAILAAGLCLAAGCSDAPSKDQCEKLLDHLIELEMKAGGTDAELTPEMKDDLAKQKTQVVDFAVGQKFIETCTDKTPKKVVECGLAAKSAEDLAKCDGN
jgi:hypothetical protein